MRRAVGAIGRLAFTSTLATTQILRRCMQAANPAERAEATVLQERLAAADVPSLLRILRANGAQMRFLLELAGRSGGATCNAEELAVELIARAELDLGMLHRLQRPARRRPAIA